jgi:large subunit ribosomal protein L18
MKTVQEKKAITRNRRTMRVRKRLRGDNEKPRLCVVKTNLHIYAQLIDDEKGVTLGSVSTLSKESRAAGTVRKNQENAKILGEKLASLALEKGIKEVAFDRGPHRYHGILAAFADAARGAGLKF